MMMMMEMLLHHLHWLLPLALLLAAETLEAGEVGFCYGRYANNLPAPEQVAQFLVQKGIRKVRIFDSDQSVIQAFANTNIDLMIGIPNADLPIFQTELQADAWVTSFLAPLLPATKITVIAVGSEVLTNDAGMVDLLLPALKNLHTGLTKANLSSLITVTTANSMAVLQDSFPPSSATFNQSFSMVPLLEFLQSVGSFVMINAYPYLAYNKNLSQVPLSYALGTQSNNAPVLDPRTSLPYSSLLDAQLDALYYAMEGVGHPELRIVVSETGWPTMGGAGESGATAQNAATYNGNIVDRVVMNIGTPHRPDQPLDAYIFSLFNENMKAGPVSERNWGVFYANETMVYDLDLNGSNAKPSPTQLPNGTTGLWCVVTPGANQDSLSDGINWACGQGQADCGLIQQGQPCYQPNTLQNHASYAYNSYYQKNHGKPGSCNFGGTAMTTNTDPSYGSCKFASLDIGAQSPSSSRNGNVSSAAALYLHQWRLSILSFVCLVSFL